SWFSSRVVIPRAGGIRNTSPTSPGAHGRPSGPSTTKSVPIILALNTEGQFGARRVLATYPPASSLPPQYSINRTAFSLGPSEPHQIGVIIGVGCFTAGTEQPDGGPIHFLRASCPPPPTDDAGN